MESHRRHSMRAAAASPPLSPRSQPLPTSPASPLLPRPDAMARSPAAPTATPMSPAAPNPTPRSPAASTPTPRAPDASIPTPRWPPPPTSTPKSSATDLEEHKGTSELLRAIKIEKANGPDLEEHKGASEPHMEPPKCKKRKPSRQSSGELHGEHQETNKVVMKPSTSKKKRKASEEMCTNPPAPPLGPLAVDMDKQAPPLKKKRLNKRDVATTPSLGSLPVDKDKQPSLGSLPVDKNKQPSSGSLSIDKNKQPSLSKKVVITVVITWGCYITAIARDILAVSASTVPAEAAFSNVGRIITDQRSSLTPSTVETLMCLEDWLRAADRQKAEPTAGDHGGDQDDAGTT